MRIVRKLPLVIVFLTLVSIMATSLIGISRSTAQLVRSSDDKMAGLVEARRARIVTVLETLAQDAEILAGNVTTMEALKAFSSAVQEMGVKTPDPAAFHPTFTRLAQKRGLGDIVLINSIGKSSIPS
jgi:hypothetical protein